MRRKEVHLRLWYPKKKKPKTKITQNSVYLYTSYPKKNKTKQTNRTITLKLESMGILFIY